MDRIADLKEILTLDPGNQLARYGLAMEYSNQGQVEDALDQFRSLIASHPDYTNAYFMAAQTLAKAGRTDEARQMLLNGLDSARRSGNRHAESEMQAMLDELG